MNVLKVGAAAAFLLGVTSSASASIVSFDVAGTLGTQGLPIHDAFDGATFGGTIDVDTDVITAQTGAYINYALSGYNIDVMAASGEVISFLGSGEEGEDASALSVLPQTRGLNFFLYENIDNLATAGFEQRLLRLNFIADTNDPVSSLAALLAADPNFGDASNFEVGALQFSTSQVSSSIASATVTVQSDVVLAAVPLPAGGLLLLTGVAGFIGLRRRARRSL